MKISLHKLIAGVFALCASFSVLADETTSTLMYTSTNLPNGYVGQSLMNLTFDYDENLRMASEGSYEYINDGASKVYTSCLIELKDENGLTSDPTTESPVYRVSANVNYRNQKQVQVQIMQNFTGLPLEDGLSYTLTFKEGAIVAQSGAINPEFTISFSFREPLPCVYTPADGAIVSEVKEIIIDNPDGIYASDYTAALYKDDTLLQDGITGGSYVFNESTGEYEPLSYGDKRTPTRVIAKFANPLTEAGTYTFKMQAEFIYFISLVGIPATTLTFTVDGSASIDNILVDNSEAIYYNLLGTKVPANELKTGIYIKVTGSKSEKVIVR